MTSNSPNASALEAALDDIVWGLQIPAQRPIKERTQGTVFEDYRLGFRLGTTEPGWKVQRSELPGASSLASMALLDRGIASCGAFAVCAAQIEEGFLLDCMLKGMGQEVRISPTTKKESKDALAGLPAKRVEMAGWKGLKRLAVSIWIIRRGNTHYGLFASEELGLFSSGKPKIFESCREFFSLLD